MAPCLTRCPPAALQRPCGDDHGPFPPRPAPPGAVSTQRPGRLPTELCDAELRPPGDSPAAPSSRHREQRGAAAASSPCPQRGPAADTRRAPQPQPPPAPPLFRVTTDPAPAASTDRRAGQSPPGCAGRRRDDGHALPPPVELGCAAGLPSRPFESRRGRRREGGRRADWLSSRPMARARFAEGAGILQCARARCGAWREGAGRHLAASRDGCQATRHGVAGAQLPGLPGRPNGAAARYRDLCRDGNWQRSPKGGSGVPVVVPLLARACQSRAPRPLAVPAPTERVWHKMAAAPGRGSWPLPRQAPAGRACVGSQASQYCNLLK